MTEQQKRYHIEHAIADNIFVEAGAGAGKTSLITKRIVSQLRNGILPEHLVVITFTNAAAGELFGRISGILEDALNDRLSGETFSEEEKERLRYALEHMDRMTVSTIHSFCYKLLKERCFDANLPMEAELLEPVDAEEYQMESLNESLKYLTRQELSELQEAATFFSGGKYYREWLEQAYFKLCDKPEDVAPVCLSETELAVEKQEYMNIVAQMNQAEQILSQEIAALGTFLVQTVNQVAQKSWNTVEDLLKAGVLYTDYGSIFQDIKTEKKVKLLNKLMQAADAAIYKKGRSNADKAISGPINSAFYIRLMQSTNLTAAIQLLEKLEEKRKQKAMTYFYFVLLKFAKKAASEYKKARNGRYVTNDEILQRANALVCGSASARAYFAERYHHIYVDEFQDTDHVQAELIWRLCCDETGKLKQGSLFVVGDPKQAIYRFRGGEPAVYYEIKERMNRQGDGTAVFELGFNFRSNKELIDWVNDRFEEPIQNYGGTYTKMLCQKNQAVSKPGLLKGVYRFDSQIEDLLHKRNKKEEIPKREAAVLAELIQTLVKNPYQVASGNESGLRRIEYRDFLILCWKMDDMGYYLKEFRRCGIPVEFSGRMTLTNQKVLNRFCRLYRYLALQRDTKAKEGASPVVVREKSEAMKPALTAGRLKKLSENTKGLDGYALAQYLVVHPEYVISWEETISKEKLYTIQVQLRQMVETVCQAKRGTAAELAEEFTAYVERGMERELPLKEGQNAVRFMNLHKAKGLQGTITILTNRQAYSENRPTPELLVAKPGEDGSYPYYCVLRKYNEFKHQPEELTGYLRFPDAMKKAWEEEEAEDIRLEYVAATRAKEALIVMSAYASPAPFERYSIADSMEKFMGDTKQAWLAEQNNTASVQQVSQPASCNEEEETEDTPYFHEIPEAFLEHRYISLSPSMLENHATGTAEEDEENAEESGEEKRPRGKVFGTVMHRSFELLVNSVWERGLDRKSIPETVLSSCICQAIMEHAEDLQREGKRLYFHNEDTGEDYLSIVKEYLMAALRRFVEKGTLEALLLDAAEVYTELPFYYYVYPEQEEALLVALQPYLRQHKMEDAMNKTIWVNGTADLIIRKKDGTVHIVDYKSDSIKNLTVEALEAVLERRYEGQMLLYRYSMSRIFRVNPEDISVRLQHLY